MVAITFDTLSSARRLREKGASQELAEAIADELKTASETTAAQLSGKEEIQIFKSDIKADFAIMRGEILRMQSETHRWMFGGFLTVIGMLTALFLKLS